MVSFILKILIQELVGALVKAATDFITLQKKKKKDKEEVKDIVNEKDPTERAKRMRDFLSS